MRRYLLFMSVLTLAAVLLVLALRSGIRERAAAAPFDAPASAQTLPVLGEIGDFELTDQNGAAFSSAALAGKVYVADFFFTSCAGICPVMSNAMRDLQGAFAEDPRVAFVSISVDPETDTPAVLAKYAERYGAVPGKWHFLTGEAGAIQRLARERFLLGNGDEPVNHSSRFVLVDGSGRIRGFYFGNEPDSVEVLRADLPRVLAESNP